jgi:hypothetical protein
MDIAAKGSATGIATAICTIDPIICLFLWTPLSMLARIQIPFEFHSFFTVDFSTKSRVLVIIDVFWFQFLFLFEPECVCTRMCGRF